MGNCKNCHKEVRNSKTHKCAKTTATKLLPCKQCSKQFSRASNLYQHINSAHESNKEFQCDKCDKTFSHAKNLKRHRSTHTNEDLVCQFCKTKFDTTKALHNHKQLKHPGQMKMKCDKCNKSFQHELSFKVHSDYCHSDKKCKQCHKQFTNLKTLRRHVISIHEKALIYECDMCDSKFSVQNKLHLHKLKEHENVEFKCANCDKKFAHTTNLKKHLEKCKPEAPSKLPFQCDICHRSFRFELTCKHHIQICKKGSPASEGIDINSANTPKCDICDSTFATVALLHKHILRSHNKNKKTSPTQNGSSKDSNEKKRSKENISPIVTVDEEISFRKPSPLPPTLKSDKSLSQKGSSSPKKSKPGVKRHILAKPTSIILECKFCGESITKGNMSRHIFRRHKDQTQNSNSNSTRIIKRKEKSPPAEATKNEKSKPKSTVSKLSSADVPVKCQTCSTTFATKHELYTHEEKQHNFTRKFTCAGCDSKFDSSKKYSEHLNKIHDKKCDACGTKFNDKREFKEHFETGMCESALMAKFNETIVARCDICRIKFNGAESLEKHVLKFHLNKVNQRDICDAMANLGMIPEIDSFMAYLGLQRVVQYL